MRDLHEHAGAIAGERIGADRTAMLEVLQDAQRVPDDRVRLAPFHVRDEADAASIVLVRGVVEALCLRHHGGLVGRLWAVGNVARHSTRDLGAGALRVSCNRLRRRLS